MAPMSWPSKQQQSISNVQGCKKAIVENIIGALFAYIVTAVPKDQKNPLTLLNAFFEMP